MNMRLLEAFSDSMEKYIGPANWKKMEEYLSGFDYFDETASSYFSFPNSDAAFKVSKKIIEDAKALVSEGKNGPAINYILYRCAGIINTSGRAYNSLKAGTTAVNDITGTGLNNFVGYISEAYLRLVEPNGVIDHFDLSKYSYGDLMNNVSARLGDELKNVGRKLLASELNNGVNYDGVRSKSVVTYDKDTGKYYNKKTGKEITSEEAKELQAKADIRRMAKTKSFDNTSNEDYNDDKGAGSSMDKLVSEYADATGDNLGEFEDDVIAKLDGPEIVEDWKNCCMDSEWKKKDNIKAKLLRTLIEDVLDGTFNGQKEFYEKYHLNKQTARNYIGLTDRETYPGVTIKDILEDYLGDDGLEKLIGYIKENPEKRDVLLSLLPGGKLHEALVRYMANLKKIREATEAAPSIKLSEDVKPYYESFKSAINEAITTVDWTETNGDDVKQILESKLKDGIAAHKNTWKFMAGAFDFGMNKLQRKVVCDIINK